MPRKPTEWPSRNELVLAVVKTVNPFSVIVELEEYGNKEGMIHISEIARRWIKDIREFAKEGQRIVVRVMEVDTEKKFVSLSLKRVDKNEAEERLKEYKREQKAEKMLVDVGKELGMKPDETFKKIGFKLQEQFGEMFKAFQMSLTPQGYDLMLRKGTDKKILDTIRSVAEKQMEVKEIIIKARLELKCYKSDGVEIIKKALVNAESKGVHVHYISAPNYTIELMTKDAKAGERKLNEIAASIIEQIRVAGGEGSYKL